MNIFLTNTDVSLAVSELCNEHLSKMPSESVQLLSYVLNYHLKLNLPHLCKVNVAYAKHPCTVWATNPIHFLWLLDYTTTIFSHFKRKRKKIHGSFSKLLAIQHYVNTNTELQTWLANSYNKPLESIYLAMPTELQEEFQSNIISSPVGGKDIHVATVEQGILAYQKYICTKLFDIKRNPRRPLWVDNPVPTWYTEL